MGLSLPSTQAPVADKNQVVQPAWYGFFQQLYNALIFTGTAVPGQIVIFSSGSNHVTPGPPVSTITDADLLAWLGL